MMFNIRLLLISFFILWSPFIKADWMNLTGAETSQNIAEIYILDDHVKVKLEVYVGDLDKFEELLPDEWLKDPVDDRPTLEQRMHKFSTERLQFITEKGVKLPAAKVGEVSTAYVAPGMEVQVSVKSRVMLSYWYEVIVGGSGAVSIKTKLS